MHSQLETALSTASQRRGLILYLAGVVSYFVAYGVQNFAPESGWSTSMIGFTASAYTNLIWMTGLGLLGDRFQFSTSWRYRPAFYIVPATIFIILHTRHSILYFRSRF